MPKRTKRTPKQLSVVIPVYNEERTITEVIKQVRSAPVKSIELIVVDDGSTDSTRSLLKRNAKKIDHLIFRKQNGGKGAALRDGILRASGDIVLIQDADLEYDPAEYPRLIEPILQDRADVVYGSRFVGSDPHRVVYFWHFAANQLLTLMSNVATNLNLTDMETGYKVFRRQVLQSISIEENGFGIEPELTAKIAARRVRMYEVGISYHGRTYEDGKKIGFSDALRAIWVIMKYAVTLRLLPRVR